MTCLDISQTDFQTVNIKYRSLSFFLRYDFFWNNQKRIPESVLFERGRIKTFFLGAIVIDEILEEQNGFRIERSFNLSIPGNIQISFTLDLETIPKIPILFPCFYSKLKVPEKRIMVLGERLAFPCGVFLYLQEYGVLVFSDPPRNKEQLGSIGISTVPDEDRGNLPRVEVFFPPLEDPASMIGPKPADYQAPIAYKFQSQGNHEMRFGLNVVISPIRKIHSLGSRTVLDKINFRLRQFPSVKECMDKIEKGVDYCLEDLLLDDRGICGLRIAKDSKYLSSSAGSGLANLLCRLNSDDGRKKETAFKLLDFTLKVSIRPDHSLNGILSTRVGGRWFP